MEKEGDLAIEGVRYVRDSPESEVSSTSQKLGDVTLRLAQPLREISLPQILAFHLFRNGLGDFKDEFFLTQQSAILP
jgi:hypothetical protein